MQAAQAFLRWQVPGASLPLLFVKDMPKPSTKLRLDFSSLLGPLFYMWVWQMLYPVSYGQPSFCALAVFGAVGRQPFSLVVAVARNPLSGSVGEQ